MNSDRERTLKPLLDVEISRYDNEESFFATLYEHKTLPSDDLLEAVWVLVAEMKASTFEHIIGINYETPSSILLLNGSMSAIVRLKMYIPYTRYLRGLDVQLKDL